MNSTFPYGIHATSMTEWQAALFPATDARYGYGTKVQWIAVAALVNLVSDGKAIDKGWLE